MNRKRIKTSDTARLDSILSHTKATGNCVNGEYQFVSHFWTKNRFPGRRDIDRAIRLCEETMRVCKCGHAFESHDAWCKTHRNCCLYDICPCIEYRPRKTRVRRKIK